MNSEILFLMVFIICSGIDDARGQDYFNNLDDEVLGRYKSQRSLVTALKKYNATFPMLTLKTPSVEESAMDSLDVVPPLGNSGYEVSCKGIEKEISRTGKEASCRPRKTLVKLNADAGYMYIPDVVIVNRCEGMCGHYSQSCMRMESVSKKIQVKRLERYTWSYVRRTPGCWELEVEEHTKCKCGCNLMASDCNSRQRYNRNACKCECNNVEEKLACETKDDMYWDAETCRCNCNMAEEICNTKLVWVPSMCKCVQVMDNTIPQ